MKLKDYEKKFIFYTLCAVLLYLLLFHFKYRIYPNIDIRNSGGYYANLTGVYTIDRGYQSCNLLLLNTFKNFTYCNHKRIEGANPLTFEALGSYYAKDDDQAFIVTYYGDPYPPARLKVFGADPETLEVLHHFAYARDKDNIFYQGERMSVDIQTFKVLDIQEESSGHRYPISHDKDYYYFRDKKIADYNPNLNENELIEFRDIYFDTYVR